MIYVLIVESVLKLVRQVRQMEQAEVILLIMDVALTVERALENVQQEPFWKTEQATKLMR